MKKIVESHEKWHEGEEGTNVYVEGWVNILCVGEALIMAAKAGNLTPGGIRDAFEQFRNFDTGGLAPPLTFTKTDHRGSMAAKIYQVKDGKMEGFDYEHCKGCGICASICPVKCIKMEKE